MALDAISAIFALDSEDNGLPWVQMFDESGGLDRLEQLQEHENRWATSCCRICTLCLRTVLLVSLGWVGPAIKTKRKELRSYNRKLQ